MAIDILLISGDTDFDAEYSSANAPLTYLRAPVKRLLEGMRSHFYHHDRVPGLGGSMGGKSPKTGTSNH